MKRSIYQVTCNNTFLCEKFTWNAAIKAVEAASRAIARERGINLELIDSESIQEGLHYVHGWRTWADKGHKVKLSYLINKLN